MDQLQQLWAQMEDPRPQCEVRPRRPVIDDGGGEDYENLGAAAIVPFRGLLGDDTSPDNSEAEPEEPEKPEELDPDFREREEEGVRIILELVILEPEGGKKKVKGYNIILWVIISSRIFNSNRVCLCVAEQIAIITVQYVVPRA